MIARHRHGLRQAVKQPVAAMGDMAELAMHDLWRLHNAPAKGLGNALMTKAYAKYRQHVGRIADKVETNTGFVRVARAGGDNNRLRFGGQHLINAGFVIACICSLALFYAKTSKTFVKACNLTA